MVFCNKVAYFIYDKDLQVTILILVDGFLQWLMKYLTVRSLLVTILILIDGFLQLLEILEKKPIKKSQSLF